MFSSQHFSSTYPKKNISREWINQSTNTFNESIFGSFQYYVKDSIVDDGGKRSSDESSSIIGCQFNESYLNILEPLKILFLYKSL